MKSNYPYTATGMLPTLLNLPDNHEYEWDKVQQERKERHPKYLGGNYREIAVKVKPFPGCFRNTNIGL